MKKKVLRKAGRPMMGDKKMVHVAISIDPDLADRWRRHLNKHKLNGSALVRDFITGILDAKRIYRSQDT